MDKMDKAIAEIKAFNEEERESGKIKEGFEKWYDTLKTTVYGLAYEDDKKAYMYLGYQIGYKSRDEELDEVVKQERNKLFALMTGLEIENIPKFLNEADIGDYGKLGLLIAQKTKQLVKQEREECEIVIIYLLQKYNLNQIAIAGVEGALEDSIEAIRQRGKE